MDSSLKPELFLRNLPEDYLCSFCLFVLQQPHLMSCCGAHLCQTCIGRIQESKRSSPCCKEKYGDYTTLLDKSLERKIQHLKVHCKNDECDWKGELKDFKSHLLQECLIQVVTCPKECGGMFPRRLLADHQMKQCSGALLAYDSSSKMPPNVTNSKEYREGKDEDMIREPTRDDDATMACLKDEMNIQAEMLRNLMMKIEKIELNMKQTALEEKLMYDFYEKFSDYQKEIDDKLQKLPTEDMNLAQRTSLSDKKIEYKLIDSQWPLPISPLAILLSVPPLLFTMKQFATYKKNKEEWYSPPVYSTDNGYRFVVGIFASGDGQGKNTHVSLKVYLAKGEHDDKLQWPFRGHFKISLLNWRENYCNGNVDTHHPATIMFDDRAKVNGLSDRVIKGDRAINGNGFPRFIYNDSLCFNRLTNTEYLRNDTLCFCVSEIRTD